MHPMVNTAVRAAREAGNIIVRQLDRMDRVQVTAKGVNDFVSDVDRKAEDAIVRVLSAAYPSHSILAEESGRVEGSDAEHVWIIDPLDGTTNFLHQIPHFSVSIALQSQGRLTAAVVYDPIRQELFTAHRGGGATLDGRKIRVRKATSLQGRLIGTGFPFRVPRYREPYLNMFRAVSARAGDLRRAGSAALDLAYVACGRLDGYWELGLAPWDIAAGALLVREAGGMISDFSGEEHYLRNGQVVAGSPRLFHDLLREIQPHCTPDMLSASPHEPAS
jgi:myo-inositol-1(or 4)-monophosphatase